MKIFAISDTHGYHDEVKLLEADMIIHAGDLTHIGTEKQFLQFLRWFEDIDYEHKVFIAGNHDFFLENEEVNKIRSLIPECIYYLNDSGVNIGGIHFWGSPVQPWFHNWAFNRNRGEEISKHWRLIPENTEILITHGPPKGVLDLVGRSESEGCQDLLNRVEKVKPVYHIFGHIHECHGLISNGSTTFINASFVDEHYNPKNQGIVFEVKNH